MGIDAMCAVFTVEKQETSMVAHGAPGRETWEREVTSTTLLFGLYDSHAQTPAPPPANTIGGTLSAIVPAVPDSATSKPGMKVPGQLTITEATKITVVLFTGDSACQIDGAVGDAAGLKTGMLIYATLGSDGKTATDLRAYTTPIYVERIVFPGDLVTITGMRLELKVSPQVARVLGGHVFYLFDTVGKGERPKPKDERPKGDEPFDLNAVGYPPLGLRHSPPGFTDYEKQLWRPIWDMMPTGEPDDTAGAKDRPVQRTNLPLDNGNDEAKWRISVLPGLLYKAQGRRMPDGSNGIQIDPTVDQAAVAAILRLARAQDEDAARGISRMPPEPGGAK
jgi:hypothetical protein